MYKPVNVKALKNYKLWLAYSDGTSGEVDLSHLVGKGVFRFWDKYNNFEQVHIGKHGEVAWSDKIDLCSDALYMRIVGKNAEELFGEMNIEVENA